MEEVSVKAPGPNFLKAPETTLILTKRIFSTYPSRLPNTPYSAALKTPLNYILITHPTLVTSDAPKLSKLT